MPLVLLQHFRGNLDNWDPALIDALAEDRRVVTFDNVGVGATTGRTPNTIEAMAHDAIAFLEAMELQRVDLLGFSIGPDDQRGDVVNRDNDDGAFMEPRGCNRWQPIADRRGAKTP